MFGCLQVTRILRAVVCLLVVVQFAACSSLAYYAQAVDGHMLLMSKRKPIEQLLADERTGPRLIALLTRVQEMREFATQTLKLPENGSYRSYAAVEGEAVVWSLVAADALSVAPRQWCYPLIGCASYRGFFHQEAANKYASEMAAEGFDVAVEPVPAYSTLGWFDDPLPGSVLHWPEWQIAGLIFHELAHQQLYVAGDSAFNEAFANSVQRIGVERWLAQRDPDALPQWRQDVVRGQQVIALLMRSRERLRQLYAGTSSRAEKLLEKQLLFNDLRSDYLKLRGAWGGYSGYDRWFDAELNNAKLASVATYEQWAPLFDKLLQRAQGDMTRFYRDCETLAQLPIDQRRQRMFALIE
ncbi:MAG: aminopeptidase [Gammaproteobacteria bacterium]|nr:aminopeptidase [Gammaproteobacteria bacterium]